MLGILHTPLWIVYLIATNSAEHLRGRGEGNFRKQINKAVISHSPYTTAKIPGSNCFSGKLATYGNPSEKLSACRAPRLGRWDDRESSSIQVTGFLQIALLHNKNIPFSFHKHYKSFPANVQKNDGSVSAQNWAGPQMLFSQQSKFSHLNKDSSIFTGKCFSICLFPLKNRKEYFVINYITNPEQLLRHR